MGRIVVMRGTSGSGKTYVAYNVLDAAGKHEEEVVGGPRGGVVGYKWPSRKLFMQGKYGNPCGGCDSFSWPGAGQNMEDWLAEHLAMGYDCFIEGLMVATWGWERLLRLDAAGKASDAENPLRSSNAEADPDAGLTVVHLTTSLDECMDSVLRRRQERAKITGKEVKPVSPKNIEFKHRTLPPHSRNQVKRGVRVEYLSREEATPRVFGLLGLTPGEPGTWLRAMGKL